MTSRVFFYGTLNINIGTAGILNIAVVYLDLSLSIFLPRSFSLDLSQSFLSLFLSQPFVIDFVSQSFSIFLSVFNRLGCILELILSMYRYLCYPGDVSIRSRNGAPSRKGCVVNGQMTKTNNKLVPPSLPLTRPLPRTVSLSILRTKG